jgi:hypothetical protein
MLLEGGNGRYGFNFSVAKVNRGTMDQPRPTGEPQDWGRFDAAWPNLIDAARGREGLDFETLAPQIYLEASKDDEAFETLGIKFPTELVTKYGLVLLVGVQLYLLLYLKRLSGILAADDAGWNMPWMGMDPSLLGRAMMFATLYVLPLAASSAIAFRSLKAILLNDESFHWFGLPGRIWMDAFTFAMLFLCIRLCSACWKHRPYGKRFRSSLLLKKSKALGAIGPHLEDKGPRSA